jgi:hypothetical protein
MSYLSTYYTYTVRALSGRTGLDHLLSGVVNSFVPSCYSTAYAAQRGAERAIRRACRKAGHPSLTFGIAYTVRQGMTAGF